MAVWPLLRALGWTAKTRLFAAEMQTVDEFLVKVPNFQDGSTHNGTGAVTLAGTGGLVCTAPFTGTQCQITVPTGKTIELTGTGAINAGATSTINGASGAQVLGLFRLGPNAVWTCNGSAGNVAQVIYGQYSTCVFSSGSAISCSSGSSFTLGSGCTVAVTVGGGGNPGSVTIGAAGALNVSAVGQLNINTAFATLGAGAVLTCNGVLGNVAQVIFGQYSSCTVQSGGGVTCNSGSLFTLGSGCFVTATIGGGGNAGSLTIGADGDVIRASLSTDTYQSGAALTTNAGSIVNLIIGKTAGGTVVHGSLSVVTHESGSDLNLDGDVIRTGPLTKSGNDAWTSHRFVTDADPPVEVDAREYDILRIVLIAADRILSLDTLGTTKHMIWIRFSSNANILRVRQSGLVADLFVFTAVAGSQQTIQMFWTGAAWEVGLVGAMTVI